MDSINASNVSSKTAWPRRLFHLFSTRQVHCFNILVPLVMVVMEIMNGGRDDSPQRDTSSSFFCSSNSHFFNKAWCAKRSRAVVTPWGTSDNCEHWSQYIAMITCSQLTNFRKWGWVKTYEITYPIGSMYAIYDNIYHQYTPNVSIYTIHGSYGYIITIFGYIWGEIASPLTSKLLMFLLPWICPTAPCHTLPFHHKFSWVQRWSVGVGGA